VKALFNSPAYIYNLESQEDVETNYLAGPGPVQGVDYWTPLPPIGSGMPHRSRHTQDAIKRGSDSLLEAKLKEQVTKLPRSLNNRAQSLDLTFSLSRITESGSTYPPPESPTSGTGDNSSPNSATAPSFPSVYGPPLSTRSSGVFGASMQRPGHTTSTTARDDDDDAVDEVSRVISNLGL